MTQQRRTQSAPLNEDRGHKDASVLRKPANVQALCHAPHRELLAPFGLRKSDLWIGFISEKPFLQAKKSKDLRLFLDAVNGVDAHKGLDVVAPRLDNHLSPSLVPLLSHQQCG